MLSQSKRMIWISVLFAVQTVSIFIYLSIVFPIAVALVLTIGGILFDPLSLKWVTGIFAIPFGIIIEVSFFKTSILITSMSISSFVSLALHRVSNTYLRRFWVSLIVLIGVAISILSLPHAQHNTVDWTVLVWFFAATITGSLLPATTLRRIFVLQEQ